MTWSAIYLIGCGFTLAVALEAVCSEPAMPPRTAKRVTFILCLGVIAWPVFWLILILRSKPQ